jgi:Domain of unknown function (DUF5753)
VLDGPAESTFLLDEGALRRVVGGPSLMAEQLRHIAEVAEHPNVTVRVIPFRAGPYPGLVGSSSYYIIEISAGDAYLYREDGMDTRFSRFSFLLPVYSTRFKQACQRALSPDDSLRFIRTGRVNMTGPSSPCP